MLQQTLRMSVPRLRRGASEVIFDIVKSSGDENVVLFLYINFAVLDRNITGYLAMVMDLPAIVKLKELVAAYIQRMTTNAP